MWSESRLVAVSNGAAYECLRSFLTTNRGKYTTYQPVGINAYMVNRDDHVGEKIVPIFDSYQFAFDMLQELVSPCMMYMTSSMH